MFESVKYSTILYVFTILYVQILYSTILYGFYNTI